MQISEILRAKGTQVTTVQETDTIDAVVRILAEKRLGAVVVEDRWMKLSGIFSERDLVQALARRGTEVMGLAVSELMTTRVVTCAPEDRVDEVLVRMTLRRIRHLPVMQGSQLSGIVSIGDLVHHRLDEKELEAGVLLDITRMRP
jgi:CBS domain-containing protein